MTFLQICQEVSKLVGLQGTIQSVTTVTGYQSTLVEYVKSAYTDIQSYRDEWNFLKTYVDISLVQGDTSYTSVSDVTKWDMYNILYDSTPLSVVPYEYYEQTEVGTSSQTKPWVVAQDYSTKYLYFNPVDTSYTIRAYYWSQPESLSNNNDTPAIPTEYHQLIIYKASADFAAFIGNSNLYQLYSSKADNYMGKLLRSANPAKRICIKRFV